MNAQLWAIVVGAPLLGGAAGGLAAAVMILRGLRARTQAARQAAYLEGWCKRGKVSGTNVPDMIFTADGRLVPKVTADPADVDPYDGAATLRTAQWSRPPGGNATVQPPRPAGRRERHWSVLDPEGRRIDDTLITVGPDAPDDGGDGLAWDGPGPRGTARDPKAIERDRQARRRRPAGHARTQEVIDEITRRHITEQ